MHANNLLGKNSMLFLDICHLIKKIVGMHECRILKGGQMARKGLGRIISYGSHRLLIDSSASSLRAFSSQLDSLFVLELGNNELLTMYKTAFTHQ